MQVFLNANIDRGFNLKRVILYVLYIVPVIFLCEIMFESNTANKNLDILSEQIFMQNQIMFQLNQKIIKQDEYTLMYDQDLIRRQFFDYASEAAGGQILNYFTSPTFDNSKWVTFYSIKLFKIKISPYVVIQDLLTPGNCWAFAGQNGELTIKLFKSIYPSFISVEHISKEASLNNNLDSAPREFSLIGYSEKIENSPEIFLGVFEYKINTRFTRQFFEIDARNFGVTGIKIFKFRFHNNYGNEAYTCIYKIRIHGEEIKE